MVVGFVGVGLVEVELVGGVWVRGVWVRGGRIGSWWLRSWGWLKLEELPVWRKLEGWRAGADLLLDEVLFWSMICSMAGQGGPSSLDLPKGCFRVHWGLVGRGRFSPK